jgi:hypothetical protein
MTLTPLIACANSMSVNEESLAVGDLAPWGVALAAVVLHVLRFRQPRLLDRSMILGLGGLAGGLAGAALELKFKVSSFGLFTIPLVLGLIVWLRVRPRWFLLKERDVNAAGFVWRRPSPAPAPAPKVEVEVPAKGAPPAVADWPLPVSTPLA